MTAPHWSSLIHLNRALLGPIGCQINSATPFTYIVLPLILYVSHFLSMKLKVLLFLNIKEEWGLSQSFPYDVCTHEPER